MKLSWIRSLRAGAILCVGVQAVSALGQQAHDPDTHDDPVRRAEIRRISAMAKGAEKPLREARVALREGRYADVRALCEKARYILAAVDAEMHGGQNAEAPVHAVLAELYLAQRKYALALSEVEQTHPWDQNRVVIDRVLALCGLGRTKEALALLEGEIGSERGKRHTKFGIGLWDAPIDRSSSKDAIVATALAARSQLGAFGVELEDDLRDLEAANRLVPKNGTIEVLLGQSLLYLKRPDEAFRHLNLAYEYGGQATRRDAKPLSEGAERMRQATEPKNGGSGSSG